jgi:hypothetical protein
VQSHARDQEVSGQYVLFNCNSRSWPHLSTCGKLVVTGFAWLLPCVFSCVSQSLCFFTSAGSVMKQSVVSPSTTFHKTVTSTDAKLAQDYMSRQEKAFLDSITFGSIGSGSTGSISTAVAAGLKCTPDESSSQNTKKTSSSKKQKQHASAGPQRVSPTLSTEETIRTIHPDDKNTSMHRGPAAMFPAVIVPTVLSLATLSHWDIAAMVNGRNPASSTFQ